MNIGKKLEELRNQHNMSIEDVAIAINVSVDQIKKYENNELEPTLDKKLMLANLFNVGLDTFTIVNTHNYKTLPSSNREEESTSVVEEPQPLEEEISDDVLLESNIIYDENVFNVIFGTIPKGDNALRIMFIIGYLIAGTVTLFQIPVLSVICFVIASFSIFNLVRRNTSYKKVKESWLNSYNGKKREYKFYKDRIVVIATEDTQRLPLELKFDDLRTFVETNKYYISMSKTQAGLIIVIDKNEFTNGTKEDFKQLIKDNQLELIEHQTQNQQSQVENKRLNTICWILFILSLVSIGIGSFIVNLFTKDHLLWVEILKYSIGIIFPIASIIVAILFKKKHNFSSKKNIYVGIVMLLLGLFSIVASISNNITLKANNNNELNSKLESLLQINIPDTYYTSVLETSNGHIIVNGEKEYLLTSWRLIEFGKNSEINVFEESLKNLQKESNKKIFTIPDKYLVTFQKTGIDFSKDPTYCYIIEEELSIIEFQYYETYDVMIIVEYKK